MAKGLWLGANLTCSNKEGNQKQNAVSTTSIETIWTA